MRHVVSNICTRQLPECKEELQDTKLYVRWVARTEGMVEVIRKEHDSLSDKVMSLEVSEKQLELALQVSENQAAQHFRQIKDQSRHIQLQSMQMQSQGNRLEELARVVQELRQRNPNSGNMHVLHPLFLRIYYNYLLHIMQYSCCA